MVARVGMEHLVPMTRRALLALTALAAISVSAWRAEEPIIARNVALDTFEVAELLAVPEEVVVSGVQNRSNGDMAGQSYHDFLDIGADEEELENASRIGGWVGGIGQMGTTTWTFMGDDGIIERTEEVRVTLISISIAVDAYESEADAERIIDRAPASASGNAFPVRLVGDASVAWPHGLGGITADFPGFPICPCDLIFRVGHLVAAVGGPSRPGPVPQATQIIGPLQLSVAEALATKMRRAQEDGQR